MAVIPPQKLTCTLICKQSAVRSVRFNGKVEVLSHVSSLIVSLVDGNYCITTGSDKTVKLWNPHLPKGLLLKTYTGHGYEVLDACGSSDNSQIASGGGDKMIFVWDVTTGKPLRKFRGHAGMLNVFVCGANEIKRLLLGR